MNPFDRIGQRLTNFNSLYDDDGPSATVLESRPMFANGQLVQPSNDGSRPGYAGDDFVNLNDIKKYNKNLLDKSIIVSTAPGRTGANQAAPVTLRNMFNVVEKTQGGDVLINNFKKNPTSENFLKLRARRKNRLAFEREQALPAEQKEEIRKKDRIAEKKWRASGKGQSYYNELLAKDGIFPARTAQERVWRDIYRASKQSKEDSRFKIKYPKNIEIDPETNLPKKVKAKSGKYYIPWDRYYKNISFYDTETKSTIKFGNMREWMKNNIKGGGKKYDNAIQNYNIRQNISDFDVDGKSLGAIAKENKKGTYAKKLTTPAAVNHRSGLNNFWDTEITTSTGNAQLNDKVQSKISAYKNASNPNIKNKILKQMKAEINKIQGGATLVVDGETIGKKPTLRKVSNVLANELNVNLLKLAGTVNPRCRKAAVDGGRMGFQNGLSSEFCLGEAKKVLNKGLEKGFKKGAQATLATAILKAGKGLKDVASIRGLLGPAALGFIAAEQGAYVGYDMLSKGKSFKEAIGDSAFNYLAGDKTKVDPIKERNKRMIEEGMTPEQMGKIGAMESTFDRINYGNSLLNKIDTIKNNRDLISMNPEDAFNEKTLQSNLDKKENEARTNLREFYRGDTNFGADIEGGQEALAEGLRRNELAQLQSVDNIFQSKKGDDYRTARKRELMLQNPDILNYMGSYPTTLGFAGGGIAGLSGGDPKGAMTRSMNPDSQGLSYLFNRVKKI